MVTMATTTLPPSKSRLDPATMKFTAVKVDVSKLTKRCRCKAFVISSQTTSRDLADMVLRKLRIDVKGHVTGTCLLADSSEGRKVLLDPEEKVLDQQGPKSRKALTFELVPADSIDPILLLTSLKPASGDDVDTIKAGNLANPSKNGMTLPGYNKIDANCNIAIGEGFLTSTPNPECDSLASTVDSGFMIHYEPFNGTDNAKRVRSKSFELARDNGHTNKLDLSGNASDSGMIINGNGHCHADTWIADNGLEDYHYRPSPQDGFQILQSKNSAWTPFSRYASDGLLKGANHVMPLTNSVPDVRDDVMVQRMDARVRRRRSLPHMSISQEEINEKKRSVADLFAAKLKLYMEKSRKEVKTKPEKRNPVLATVPHQYARDDDTISVTSQEVAEILSSASPLKPYEEDDIPESDESASESPNRKKQSVTPQNVFQPLPDTAQPDSDQSFSESKPQPNTGAIAIESMSKLITRTPPNSSIPSLSYNHKCSEYKRERITPKSNSSTPDPQKPRRTQYRAPERHLDRGVPLFALLTTHLLAPVMVRRNLQASAQFLGVRLCDVTYVKCVRHVIKHWETSSRQFTVDPKLAECMLVAVGGIDRRATVVIAGKLFRGDIVVEVNGSTTLQMSARDVMAQMSKPDVVSIVVARSRLNVERSQSP